MEFARNDYAVGLSKVFSRRDISEFDMRFVRPLLHRNAGFRAIVCQAHKRVPVRLARCAVCSGMTGRCAKSAVPLPSSWMIIWMEAQFWRTARLLLLLGGGSRQAEIAAAKRLENRP